MFWGKQRSTSSPSRLCCPSFSVGVLNFATSPNSGVKIFLGVSEVGKIDFARYFFRLCVFFLVFYFLRRPVGMSRKAWKVQRVSAAARGLIPLPPDSILNSILPRSALMSQEYDSIVDTILPCSTVLSQENDSITDLRAQDKSNLWIDWLKEYALNKLW